MRPSHLPHSTGPELPPRTLAALLWCQFFCPCGSTLLTSQSPQGYRSGMAFLGCWLSDYHRLRLRFWLLTSSTGYSGCSALVQVPWALAVGV